VPTLIKEDHVAASTGDLYEKALTLSGQSIDETFLELGKALRQLMDRDTDLFRQVVEKSELGSRKAYYLVNLSRIFEPLPIPRARLLALGWTKLMKISAHINKENWQELLEMAESHNVKQIEATLKGEKPQTNAHCFLAYFDAKDYKLVEELLVQNGAKRSGRGLLEKEAALVRIFRKFKKMTAGAEA
jgi:hypothetical protein